MSRQLHHLSSNFCLMSDACFFSCSLWKPPSGEACVAQVVCRTYSRLSGDVNVSVFARTYCLNTVLVSSGLDLRPSEVKIGLGYRMCQGASLTFEI